MPRTRNDDIEPIRTLPDGVQVGVSKGSKSSHDFKVHFRWSEARRWRTPTHVHLIVDMYTKRMGNPWLTRGFVDYVLSSLIGEAQPATRFPPDAPALDEDALVRSLLLRHSGEYTVEFILTVQGLIAKGERTNYPKGHVQQDLWEAFRDGEEIYKVLGIALPRRSSG